MRAFVILGTAVFLATAGVVISAAQEATPAPALAVDTAKGLPEWEKVYAVFSHPRCANCHVEDERPRWSGPEFPMERCMASMCRVAPMVRVSAIQDCAARPVISRPIPARHMVLLAPRAGIWRRLKWSGSTSLPPRFARRSRTRSAMAADRWRRWQFMSATTTWSAGAGIPGLAASRRPVQPRRRSKLSSAGRQLVRHALDVRERAKQTHPDNSLSGLVGR